MVGCVGLVAMQAKQAIRDAVLQSAGENIDSPDIVSAVEDCALSGTEAACLGYDPLLDFEEYADVKL